MGGPIGGAPSPGAPAAHAPAGARHASSGAETYEWVVRPMGSVAICGQVEPRLEVPPLGSKRYAALQEPIAAFHVARALGAALKSRDPAVQDITVPLDELHRALFCNTHVPLALLKRAVSDVAEKVRGQNNVDLFRARGGPNSGSPRSGGDGGVAVEADDVATRFAPEDVCAYESANASAKALRMLGLEQADKIGGPGGAAVAVRALFRRCKAAQKRASELRSRARANH